MADRISKVSNEFFSPNQTAFIEGRLISNNIILADEMVYDFGRKRTPKRCLSIDLRKAFHAIKWDAIISTLEAHGFPLFYVNKCGTASLLHPSLCWWKAPPPLPLKITGV